jgi:hypothetical protein
MGASRNEVDYCLSDGPGSSSGTNDCDQVADLTNDIRPGVPQARNVTLWNVAPNSDTNAVDLRVFAGAACTSGTFGASPHGSGNLCDGLKLKIERYSSAARTGSPTCLYGCGNVFGGSLNQFAGAHGSAQDGIQIDTTFNVNEKAYLVITVLLPDTGANSHGHGNDNLYLGRSATLRLTWRMDSA